MVNTDSKDYEYLYNKYKSKYVHLSNKMRGGGLTTDLQDNGTFSDILGILGIIRASENNIFELTLTQSYDKILENNNSIIHILANDIEKLNLDKNNLNTEIQKIKLNINPGRIISDHIKNKNKYLNETLLKIYIADKKKAGYVCKNDIIVATNNVNNEKVKTSALFNSLNEILTDANMALEKLRGTIKTDMSDKLVDALSTLNAAEEALENHRHRRRYRRDPIINEKDIILLQELTVIEKNLNDDMKIAKSFYDIVNAYATIDILNTGPHSTYNTTYSTYDKIYCIKYDKPKTFEGDEYIINYNEIDYELQLQFFKFDHNINTSAIELIINECT